VMRRGPSLLTITTSSKWKFEKPEYDGEPVAVYDYGWCMYSQVGGKG
jgi:hypothetical protein